MAHITQFQFDLYPNDPNTSYFIKPNGYLFRGIFMNWLKSFDQKLGDKLHEKQPKGTPLHVMEYSLQQQYLHLDGRRTRHTNENRGKNEKKGENGENERGNSGSRTRSRYNAPQGLRYMINSMNDEISQGLLTFMLNQKDQFIQYGPQQAIITQVQIRQISLDEIISQKERVKEIKLRFLTPTSYNMMGVKSEMRFPLPQYLFGNLSRLWNMYFKDTPNEIPRDFYNWVGEHVFISSYELKTKAWHTDKGKPFSGFTGWISYIVNDSEHEFNLWLTRLAEFGEYSGTGKDRTAGFGRIKFLRNRSSQTHHLKKVN